MKESLPLSRRLRVNVAGVSAAAHALPRGAARSSPSVPAFVAFLDWFGARIALMSSKCLETVVILPGFLRTAQRLGLSDAAQFHGQIDSSSLDCIHQANEMHI